MPSITLDIGAALTGRFTQVINSVTTAIRGLDRQAKSLNATLTRLRRNQQALTAILRTCTRATAGFQAATRNTGRTVTTYNQRINSATKQHRSLASSAKAATSAQNALRRSLNATTKAQAMATASAARAQARAAAQSARGSGRKAAMGGMFGSRLGLARFGTTMGGIASLVAGGFGSRAAINQNTDLEYQLQLLANTGELDQGLIPRVREQIIALTRRNQTNLSPEQLTEVLGRYTAAGLPVVNSGLPALRTTGRTATAFGAEVSDIADAGIALMQNLRIQAGELQTSFDALAYAGKKGRFELRDMAKYMPAVAASASKIGLVGQEGVASLGAALQVVRESAGDASTAANDLYNLLEKMVSPEVLTNFREMGSDLKDVIVTAQSSGQNALEAVLDEVQRIVETAGTAEEQAFIVSKLVRDMQARRALQALLANRQQYADTKSGAKSASGITDRDYNKMASVGKGAVDSTLNSLKRIGLAVGQLLAPALEKAATLMEKLADSSTTLMQNSPGLAKTIGIVGTGLAAWAALGGPIAALFDVLLGVGAIIGDVFAAVSTAVGAASGPVIAVVAAIVAAVTAVALAVRKFWQPIQVFFSSVWKGFSSQFPAMLEAIRPLMDEIGGIFAEIKQVLIDALAPLVLTSQEMDKLRTTGEGLGKVLGIGVTNGLKLIASLAQQILHVFRWISQDVLGGKERLAEFKKLLQDLADPASELRKNFSKALDVLTKIIDLMDRGMQGSSALTGWLSDKFGPAPTEAQTNSWWDSRKRLEAIPGLWERIPGKPDTLNPVELVRSLMSGAMAKAGGDNAIRTLLDYNRGIHEDNRLDPKAIEMLRTSLGKSNSPAAPITINTTVNASGKDMADPKEFGKKLGEGMSRGITSDPAKAQRSSMFQGFGQ